MNALTVLSLVFALLVGVSTGLKGSSPQAPSTSQPPPDSTGSAQPVGPPSVMDRYRLRQGDTLDLIFPFVPTFNQTVTVQPDGYVALRVVGEVHVEGQTLPELQTTLRARHAAILRDPTMTIALRDFEKPYFIATGEVERPGKYDLRGETTVAQGLALAGGLRDRARRSQVLVFRATAAGGVEAKELNLKRILSQGHLESDLRLNPGDMIFVPKSRVPSSSVYLTMLSMLPWLIRPF
jgi:protein involved in polysaccharide export with SLBB domain